MKSKNIIEQVAYEICNAFRGKIAYSGSAVIATAFVLTKKQENPLVSVTTIEDFLKDTQIEVEIADIIYRNLNGLWDDVVSLIDKYDTETLIELVMNYNGFFNMSTPLSIINLTSEVLDITENDTILEICSGTATFPVYALQNKKIKSYTGIDINYNSNDVAILRASLLGNDYRFILDNALTYNYTSKYDKIFSNYPFAIKGNDLDECRRSIKEHFNLNDLTVSRCSSDWVFNASIIRSLETTGKAVVIMTNGATFNIPDIGMRHFFIENGFIETVINLPSKLFSDSPIPVTMLILSYNNSSVRLINAEGVFSKADRKTNTLTEENIRTILSYISDGGENAIVLSPEEMRDHDYNLMAAHYLEKPLVENGVLFSDVIKSITRGAQTKPEVLESHKSIIPTNYRYITLSNIANGLIDIEEGRQYITDIPKSLQKFVIPNNSIVLSKMASPTFRSVVVNTSNEQSIVATGNLFIIEVDEKLANPYYIQAFFDSELGEATLNHASGGMTVKTLSADAIKNIKLPLPPLDKQNEIAVKYQAALDECVILQRKLNRVLIKKRMLLDGEE